jgi:hypothetical protein
VAEQVYLSLWLRQFNERNMLRYFENVLGKFPFSRLSPAGTLRVYAIEFSEPPALERLFPEGVEAVEAAVAAREFHNPDCAYQIEANWDLYQWDSDWRLAPARVLLTCYGPEFTGGDGEHVSLDLGGDLLYLPQADAPGSYRAVQSNVRSLLHLSEELRASLPVDRLRLWSESGENLAERLDAMIAE